MSENEQAAGGVVGSPACFSCSIQGFTCYPGRGVAICHGEVCATCDDWVPDRPEDAEVGL